MTLDTKPLPVTLGHCEFTTYPGPDGLYRAHCKTCPWVGPPRPHPLDCGPTSIVHSKETG